MVVVRFSASKVALVTGLHDFGDVTEEILDCVYQDREEMLVRDAARLQLRLVSKDEEIESLVQKSGAAIAPQLRKALLWTRDQATPTNVKEAQNLLEDVDKQLAEALVSNHLVNQEAQKARKLLAERIHQSAGTRNESLALEAYERQTGSKVRLTNEHCYVLTFPPPVEMSNVNDTGQASVDYSLLAEKSQRTTIFKSQQFEWPSRFAPVDLTMNQGKEENLFHGYFSICGMVDGISDALNFAENDEWELVPVVVEVKNRLRCLQNPPPLHDYIQLAVYMKMLEFEHGDLVQCIYDTDSHPTIQISRASLGSAPLCLPVSSTGRKSDIWTEVIVPRLYAVTQLVEMLRCEELLRLAFLNGNEVERFTMIRAECDFL
ncbi:hypothetical protein PsorP6_009559 [Peronosclerospora sorghi]|uniref:Uncharacterized protein n=1 Tax=Peronosclerospora sorghi TaxID=230839 RepID=A0ACC0W0T2_9STRA|nr:hypothetical protein PsorP6_009559 [Peronosclerospora sorghi]